VSEPGPSVTSERDDKLQRLRGFCAERGFDGVVLLGRGNFAWLSGGGDNHVVSHDERGVAALLVDRERAVLLADAIEMPRISAEEPVSAFQAVSGPWPDGLAALIAAETSGGRFAADLPDAAAGLQPLPPEFLQLRAALHPAELQRYRGLGADCAAVLESLCGWCEPGMSERAIAAELSRRLLIEGIEPAVVLVACDERIQRYRHPVPTERRLDQHLMLVACGRRQGLIANLTRIVHFGLPPEALLARHEACCRIELALWSATRPGRSWGDALQAGIERYAIEGFAEEWTLHHQGGPTGYAGRDFLVTPGEQRLISDHQAVAWNPSITGSKSEDTFIVQGDERLVVTAASASWPQLSIATDDGDSVQRPGILQR